MSNNISVSLTAENYWKYKSFVLIPTIGFDFEDFKEPSKRVSITIVFLFFGIVLTVVRNK